MNFLKILTKNKVFISSKCFLAKQFEPIIIPGKSFITTRDIQEPSHESGTLLNRFIKYIALEKCKTDPIITKTVKYSQFYPFSNIHDFEQTLKNTERNQLSNIIIYTSSFKTGGNPSLVAGAISLLDRLSCDSVDSMNIQNILHILYSYFYLIPSKITKLKFYDVGLKKAVADFNEAESKHTFVQLCYYLGLAKHKNQFSKLLKDMLVQYSDLFLKELNTMDLAIVANSAYKSSIKFPFTSYNERIVSEIINGLEDKDLLITFVKSLKLNRIKSDECIKQLQKELVDNEDDFNFKGFCHIFGFFAENYYNEPNVCAKLKRIGLKLFQIQNSQNDIYMLRAKDIAAFLWGCSQLKIILDRNELDIFENIIFNRIKNKDYSGYFDELVDSCLSMLMLDYKSTRLLSHVFHNNPKKDNFPRESKVKIDSRYKLLSNIIEMDPEASKILPEHHIPSKPLNIDRSPPEYLCKNNIDLNNLYNLIIENKELLNIRNAKTVLPILEINIPGILIEYETKEKVFIEILNEKNRLRFNDEPVAILALKIKLLRKLNYQVKIVDVSKQQKLDVIETLKNQ